MNKQLITILKKGASFHMANQFQNAHDCYRQVIEIDPYSHHAHHLLGLLFLQNGFKEQSKTHFDLCLQIDPNYKEAIRNKSIFKKSIDFKVQVEFDHVEINDTYQSFPESTVGGWRHLRMIDFVDFFDNKNDTWLTIGDAYGHDAYMLKKSGLFNVTASNLESSNLESGSKINLVDKYLTINAESIPLENESFDYILCKEALHHMPRPLIAIYEMLRVARKGVFFIEPQDQIIDWPIKRNENFYREIISADAVGEKVAIIDVATQNEVSSSYIDWWEDKAFNYVYTFSKREIKKLALGMGLPSFAIKNFNDFYNPEWNSQEGKPGVEGFDKTVEQIQLNNILCEVTGKAYSSITGLLFKETPPTDVVTKLNSAGYEFNFTPTRYLPIAWPNLDN